MPGEFARTVAIRTGADRVEYVLGPLDLPGVEGLVGLPQRKGEEVPLGEASLLSRPPPGPSRPDPRPASPGPPARC